VSTVTTNVEHDSYQQHQSPTNAFAVANWFLDKSEKDNIPLNLAKLQDLVYLAYGWYYAYYESPLFDDAIFATLRGPAISTLATLFKGNGKNPIKQHIKFFQDDQIEMYEPSIYKSLNEPENHDRKILEENIEEILEGIWSTYALLPRDQILNILYRPTSPIRKICEQLNGNFHAMVIEPESIQEYFTELLDTYSEEIEQDDIKQSESNK
jgi:uncharacterized phage-associated protein